MLLDVVYIGGIYQAMTSPAAKQRIRARAKSRTRAKLFMNGRSQAVRLPKEFRVPGNEVSIRRDGAAVIIEPLPTKRGWPDGYWEELERLTRNLPDDFALPADPVPRPLRPHSKR